MTTPTPWTILFYLCGDHPDQRDAIEAKLQALAATGAAPEIAIAAQRDRQEGAERFLLTAGKPDPLANPIALGAVNTGDPAALLDFLRWGAEACPAQNIALVLAGSGSVGGPELFTFCRDDASAGALDPVKLDLALSQFLAETDYKQLDLLLLDTGAGQFIEIGHQIAGLADALIAQPAGQAQGDWDYAQLLQTWQNALKGDAPNAGTLSLAQELARSQKSAALSALNLNRLDDATRAFDAFCMALMQSLGDDIIWDVAWDKESRAAFNFGTSPAQNSADLQQFLQTIQARFQQTAQAMATRWYEEDADKLTPQELEQAKALSAQTNASPEEVEAMLSQLPAWIATEYRLIHSQGKRAADLAKLAQQTLDFLSPQAGLLLHPAAGGVSIFAPKDLDSVSKSTYLTLNFSRRVHWSALLGAINLIAQHPRALWRLTSSLMTTADSAVRENLMRRFIGPDSVMVGFRQQFQALAAPAKLTLSLEPRALPTDAAAPLPANASMYRLRLESVERGATVIEQNSLVNTNTLNTTLAELERILADPWAENATLSYLESLGRTLGEDVIQNLSEHLLQATGQMTRYGGGAPHLQLQLPRNLMRYPWELLHDDDGLLCEKYALGRQVFMETGLSRQVTRRRTGVIRALIIGDPLLNADFLAQAEQEGKKWEQLPGARDEAEQVALTFERLAQVQGQTLDFDYERDVHIQQTVSKLQFRELLRSGDYDIIHYAGHALFDPQNPEQSAWILSDGPLWAQEIRNTLAWVDTPPWLVFANACETGMDADGPVNQYQGDVFGLATAFINQGVTAYIGPLWAINDAVAQQIASDFYYALLLEYASLGESLRFAKAEAKYLIAGADGSGADMPTSASIGLSWAGLILYGDPTARLMESLWTPHHLAPSSAPAGAGAESSATQRRRMARPVRPLQASADETTALVTGPGMRMAPPQATRGGEPIASDQMEMMLVEVNGLRYWITTDGQTGELSLLPGSNLPTIVHNTEVRQAMGLQRGVKDYIRVIGRWLVDRDESSLITELAAAYDRQVVPEEKLWFIKADGSQREMRQERWQWLEGNIAAESDRVLLIIHGTFSSTFSPANGLKGSFLNWAEKYYRGVIGYDHWTLTKTPEENARELWEALDPRLKAGNKRIDIVCHSRGGLVARSMVELLGWHPAINKVAFICTPNGGTTLADPRHWGYLADTLLNLIHLDSFKLFGQLSGLLARLVSALSSVEDLGFKILDDLPGLRAQSPALTGPNDFLGRLQQGGGPPGDVTYSAIAANFEPLPYDINISSLRKLTTGGTSIDAAGDVIFPAFNDLIVDTTHVWAIDQAADISTQSSPPWLPGPQLLIYNPGQAIAAPANANVVDKLGVMHTNVFRFDETQAFLRERLKGS